MHEHKSGWMYENTGILTHSYYIERDSKPFKMNVSNKTSIYAQTWNCYNPLIQQSLLIFITLLAT